MQANAIYGYGRWMLRMHSKVGHFYLGEKLDMHRRLPENVRKLLFCKGNYEREWKREDYFIRLHTQGNNIKGISPCSGLVHME